MAAEVPELDFEKDLRDVLKKHGFPEPEQARYLIRSLDNLREYWQEYAHSAQEKFSDNISNEGTMGSPS